MPKTKNNITKIPDRAKLIVETQDGQQYELQGSGDSIRVRPLPSKDRGAVLSIIVTPITTLEIRVETRYFD